ncbi:UNVERIFIED_CONTAM: hypothetical protein GTU68_013974 [Idotea baltica]|nr:hypothetical protein [Idotea baltica]
MRMRWHDLLFMHYRVDPRQLRQLIPTGLEIDLFQGDAWIGIVPFRMSDVAPRFVPAIPWMSAFPELNVRTYVTIDGKPGVWFFSLDATNPIAVRIARRFFHLKYMDARIQDQWIDDWYHYDSRRTHRGEPAANLNVRYRPVGHVFNAEPGTLEYWLTARYCLYAATTAGELLRGEIDHPPWPLQSAEAVINDNSMLNGLDLKQVGDTPHLLFSKLIQVNAWANETVTV